MRGHHSVRFSNISATTDPFLVLVGGNYSLAVVATFGVGSVTLERLGPDGSTWLTAATAITANGMSAVLGLAPGSYRIAVATATAVYVDLTRIPVE